MWHLDSQARLVEWKQFRSQLSQCSAETALEQICNVWSYVPFVEHYLDRLSPKKWPGPWELIWENKYCDLARALGMLYTWELTDHAKHYQSEIKIFHDHKNNCRLNCFCVCPGEYVLNLSYNTVLKKHSFNSAYELIHTYPSSELIEK